MQLSRQPLNANISPFLIEKGAKCTERRKQDHEDDCQSYKEVSPVVKTASFLEPACEGMTQRYLWPPAVLAPLSPLIVSAPSDILVPPGMPVGRRITVDDSVKVDNPSTET